WILKKAMEPRLPRALLYRPKRGFEIPVRRWLRQELHEYAADLLLAPTPRLREWFDPAAVQRLWAEHQAGRRDGSDLLWLLLAFEGFARQHLTTPTVHDEARSG